MEIHWIQFGYCFDQSIENIPDKTKLYLKNMPLNMTHSYTIYRNDKSYLEKIYDNKKENKSENVSDIYTFTINDIEYYMMDVKIVKHKINIDRIRELINQIEINLQI